MEPRARLNESKRAYPKPATVGRLSSGVSSAVVTAGGGRQEESRSEGE